MIVAALDIASRTGVCVGDSSAAPKAWSVDLRRGNRSASHEVRFYAILALTAGLIEEHKPELLVVEAPIGGKEASKLLIGLEACARGCAFSRKVRCESVDPRTARKRFMGVSKTHNHFPGLTRAKAKIEIKREVMERARLIGWDVPDLDAADAAAAWNYGCAEWAPSFHEKPLGGLFNGAS